MAAEDYFDAYGYDEDAPTVECKFCGKGGLSWEDDDGRWVLIDAHGKIHKCSEKARQKVAVGQFEDLTQ